MHRKYDAQEMGYIIPDEQQRIAANGALYHLSAVLHKERNRLVMHRKLDATHATENADKEKKKPGNPVRTLMDKKNSDRLTPARYTVWYRNDEDTTAHFMGFVRFENGVPIFTNRPCKVTWFVWKGMAEKVAEKCGDGFEVVDMLPTMTADERLLRAIFREDGMDGDEQETEYHGDGTKAEDENWDGE